MKNKNFDKSGIKSFSFFYEKLSLKTAIEIKNEKRNKCNEFASECNFRFSHDDKNCLSP